MRRGVFITFEGCEGSGKSTQALLLEAYLKGRGQDVVMTREPGGTATAEKIRALILEKGNDMDGLTEALLYAAARARHVSGIIRPALESGKIVLCDRFSDSTVAYQAYARGQKVKTIERLCRTAENGCRPDATIFLDTPPEEGFFRKGGADENDRLESENLDFHKKVYQGYIKLAKRHKKRIITISAKGSQAEIHSRIIAGLKRRGVL